MDITIFLSQLWGPVLLFIGLGMFINQEYYTKIYRDLEKERVATFLFGIVAVVFGLLHIMVHNFWYGWSAVIISLLGWGTFLKGAVFLLFPKMAESNADWVVDLKLLRVSAGFVLLLGFCLIWVGYF